MAARIGRAAGALIVAAALAGGAASAQTASQTPAPAPAPSGIHLGVATCAGSACHGALEPFRQSNVAQNEYVTWSQKDKHAKAYKVLFDARSVRIAKNLGLPDAHTAEICLNCHADNPAMEQRGRQFQLSDGVGCEACHGGASGWLGTHVSGAGHAANLAAGLVPTEQPLARAKICLSCHVGSEANKFVTHKIMGAGHPRISFELDTFTAIQPAHYVVDKDYLERKGAPDGVQTWAIGQAMALAETMRAFGDPKRNPDGFFPELVFYDCHACHHPMSPPRWEPRASTGLGPGMVKFNDANVLMLKIIAQRLAPERARELGEHMLAFHRAMTENRDKSLREAAEIGRIADQLVDTFAQHRFERDDVRALAGGVIDDGLTKRDYIDYAAAEQATMALSAIINAMRATGTLNDQQFKTAYASLNKLYDTVAKDAEYRPDAFIQALRDVSQTLTTTN